MGIAAGGAVYGIELVNANAQLQGADGGRPMVVDPTGKETALPLAG